ncbi:hypothetical protein [Hymenobacter properus]|uniref:Uncharacterized protein n=1 Tax=Hymenobacter properus TaxID=2791026 RepID=A0A931BJV9_9BACT|nr:hypothetical protein [Hymenobacter properus]MBF9140815.1 hypothetical protein [Hymenobacter properus]MBR7719624.1 hypothetical protein [Microvirga sp. SRT04]
MKQKATNPNCTSCGCLLSEATRAGSRCLPCKRKLYHASPSYQASLAKRREAYGNQQEQIRRKELRSENPIKVMLTWAAQRASKRGIEFSISATDLEIPAVCPLLGIPLFIGDKTKKINSPSIDRIDNSRGYVPGNVRIISNLANSMKGGASREQLEAFAKNIAAYLASAK